MLSRLVWLRLEGKKSGFRIRFPLSPYVLTQLLESFEDLLALICLLAPRRSDSAEPRPSVYDIRDLLSMATGLVYAMVKDGPYELLHISNDDVEICLKIR